MPRSFPALGAAALAAGALFATGAQAHSQSVMFHNLVASATVQHVLEAGDTLFLDTLALGETGALSQQVTFTVADNVGAMEGFASWFVNSASRLTGVDIRVWQNGSVVADDAFQGLLAGTAVSTLGSTPIGGGTFMLEVTGNATRDASLDVAIVFAPVPEPATYGMMAAGLGIVAFLARRRQRRPD